MNPDESSHTYTLIVSRTNFLGALYKAMDHILAGLIWEALLPFEYDNTPAGNCARLEKLLANHIPCTVFGHNVGVTTTRSILQSGRWKHTAIDLEGTLALA